MRTIMLGAKGWIVLGLVAIIVAGGVWAWQAGYGPEIGKFFAADFGAVPTPGLNSLEPGQGPIGTEVTIHGKNFPSVATIQFGSGQLKPSYVDDSTMRFTVPAELPVFCPPGAYCILSMLPVQPGEYDVVVQADELCTAPTPVDGQVIADAPYECDNARSNHLTFTVTGACTPLPPCAYEGAVRCAVDPIPGTEFCPPPTPSNCIPLPSCVTDREAPCAVRPAPGTVYCTPTPTPILTCQPRPACLDSRPSCEIAEPADGWCFPTPTVTPPPRATDTDNSPDYMQPRSLIRPISPSRNPDLFTAGYGRGLVYVGASPDAAPLIFGADGSTTPSTDGYWWFYDQCADGWLREANVMIDGRLSATSIGLDYPNQYGCSNGVLVPPTVTPTPSGPPGQSGRVDLYLEQQQPVVTPGVEWQARVWLDSHGTGVTAANIVLRTPSNSSFVRFQPTPDLPEVLAKPDISPDQVMLTFALGSGPRRAGVVGSHINLGMVTLRVHDAADLRTNPAGDRFVGLLTSPGTAITISGSDRNELNGYPSLTLAIIPTSGMPGDLDGDGDVDIFDYNLVVSNFHRTPGSPGTLGDGDGDGDVDVFDYNLVVSNFRPTR